jgi:hypothetical protein
VVLSISLANALHIWFFHESWLTLATAGSFKTIGCRSYLLILSSQLAAAPRSWFSSADWLTLERVGSFAALG